MRVERLLTFGYHGCEDREWNESFPNPTWEQIEIAIRQLDAKEYAGGDFAISDMYDDGGDQPSLCIAGGNGKYEEMVAVVQGDQGVWVPANEVCTDIELIVTVARYVAETGRCYPAVQWK